MGSIPDLAGEEITYRSKLPDVDIPDRLPVHAYCFQNISAVADKPCIIHGPTGEVYTYAEVQLTARRFAAGLHGVGVRRGDVIMLLLPNSPEFVFAFLGASYSGAAATTANPFYTPAEIRKQALAAGVRLVVTQPAYVDKVRGLDGVTIVCTDGAGAASVDGCLRFSELAAADEARLPSVEVGPDDVAALPFSSGTTGLPKGVMVTHRALVSSMAQQLEGDNPNLWLREDDVVLCVLPMFHIYALNTVLLCGLRAGVAVVVVPKFDVALVAGLVQRHRVTVAPFVPPVVVALVKSPAVDEYDLSSIRMIIYGAAPMGKELEDALRAKIPGAKLGQGYGMTEAGAVSMCLGFAKEPFETKSGSCGTVVRNAQLKVVDVATGASLPRNQPGEICIRGPQIMKGYLNDPEATAATLDKEGWLHTGDIGYVDDDDEIFIVDRLKELIKYKGFQVAPAELEALLVALPGIADAAVIPMKDETAGEVPVAFVVGSNGPTSLTEYEIKRHVSEQVVFYKRIHRVFFVEAIPKAPSGKILRKGLREMLAAGFAATCRTAQSSSPSEPSVADERRQRDVLKP